MFVNSLKVGAAVASIAMVSAADPTSMPSSRPTELQGWTYGETATGAACAGTTSDPCGTDHWGEVTGYETCATGEEQSPINIVSAEPDYELRMPEFHITADGCDVSASFNIIVCTHILMSICHFCLGVGSKVSCRCFRSDRARRPHVGGVRASVPGLRRTRISLLRYAVSFTL
jgi:hypothetical protein